MSCCGAFHCSNHIECVPALSLPKTEKKNLVCRCNKKIMLSMYILSIVKNIF